MAEKAMSTTLAMKLGSLVVHVQEMALGEDSMAFDLAAAKQLTLDPEVIEWLATIDPALLPAKREE